MRPASSPSVLPALLVFPILVLLALAGCTHHAPPPAVSLSPAAAQSDYVGNQACAECHPRECRGFYATNHSRTLRRMDAESLGELSPPEGPIPASKYVLHRAGSQYEVRVPGNGERRILDYAFGSGKTGNTYVSAEDRGCVLEMGMSYFPRFHLWTVTPGQEASHSIASSLGRIYDPALSRRCLLCHAVNVPADSARVDPDLMGVGCEACHGPARAHITAARVRGATDLHMERLASAGGERINALCGRCHRTVEDVLHLPGDQQLTQRFQVFALSQSRCFQASADRLTCITCHDPHANARKDDRFYEAVCLRCHAPSRPARSALRADHGPMPPGSACPINPRTGCIGCHMPARRVFIGTRVPSTMADHLIKVYPRNRL